MFMQKRTTRSSKKLLRGRLIQGNIHWWVDLDLSVKRVCSHQLILSHNPLLIRLPSIHIMKNVRLAQLFISLLRTTNYWQLIVLISLSIYAVVYSYLTIYYALEDAFVSLVLWRGASIIVLPKPSFRTRSIKWVNVNVPLHSFFAFIAVVNLVENPDLLPSFFFASIGW